MRLGRMLVGFIHLLCALVLTWPSGAHAEVHSKPQRLVVGIPDAETGVPVEELAAALRTQLSELGVEVVLSTAPFSGEGREPPAAAGDERALAFVWLVREGDTVSVQFFEAAGATLRQRRLPLATADSASLDEVALVVRSAVSALLEREAAKERDEATQVETDRVEAEPQKDSPEQPARRPRNRGAGLARPLLAIDFGYAGQSYAEQVSFSHGAHVAVRLRPTRSLWSVGMNYALFPSQSVVSQGIETAITRHPLELFVSLEARQRQTPFFVGAQLGLSADWVRRQTTVTGDDFVPTDSATRVSWAVAARLLAGWSLTDRLSAIATGGADFVLVRVPRVLPDGEPFISPHRVRPRVLGLISWDLP